MPGMMEPNMPDPADMPPEGSMASSGLSKTMSPTDLDNPKNWPLHRKLFTSLVAWGFAASVTFQLTAYTAGLNQVVADFNQNPTGSKTFIPEAAISGYSVYLIGIFFAPIYTPHVVERIGRSKLYLTVVPISALFNLGAGLSPTFAGVAILRFLAGLAGGSSLVNIEGTFADIWSAETTNTYYAVQGTAQFVGAGLGALAGGFLVQDSGGWRWTQYAAAILGGVVWILGFGMSESYQREIPRRRAKRQGVTLEQDPPMSGATIGQIVKITVIDPFIGFVSDPVTMLSTLFAIYIFAIVMQFFITVPAALGPPPPMGAGFTPSQIGLAFTTAVAGGIVGAIFNIIIEQALRPILKRRNIPEFAKIEYRLVPAMIGFAFVFAALFWIGGTVGNMAFHPIVPIVGTAVFVLGVAMCLFAIVPYLFDAYPPAGTLSALTSAACGRILIAALLPLVILQDFTGVTPKWALFTFAFIGIPVWAIPFVLFKFGPVLRNKSRFCKDMNRGDAMNQKRNGHAEPMDMAQHNEEL